MKLGEAQSYPLISPKKTNLKHSQWKNCSQIIDKLIVAKLEGRVYVSTDNEGAQRVPQKLPNQ